MDPKPLTKEERKILDEVAEYEFRCDLCGIQSDDMRELIAAEAYWREAVKKATEVPRVYACPFCLEDAHFNGKQTVVSHDPDCPWLLAQE